MNLIDEQQKLIQYSKEHFDDIFTVIDKKKTSYWNDCKEERDIEKYEFETPIELMELLSEYIEEPELQKILTIAAFKRKGQYVQKKSSEIDKREAENLPEFVYNF